MSNAQAKTEALKLGTKRTCPSCSTKFYDFQRSPIVCPKCHAKVDETATAAPVLKAAPEKKEKPAKVGPEAGLLQDEESTAEESESFDASDDLGGDDDDVVEDIEVDNGDDDESY